MVYTIVVVAVDSAGLLAYLLWRSVNRLAPFRSDLRRIPQLTFVDFLEALARMTVLVPMPTEEDIKRVKVRCYKRSSVHNVVSIVGSFLCRCLLPINPINVSHISTSASASPAFVNVDTSSRLSHLPEGRPTLTLHRTMPLNYCAKCCGCVNVAPTFFVPFTTKRQSTVCSRWCACTEFLYPNGPARPLLCHFLPPLTRSRIFLTTKWPLLVPAKAYRSTQTT